MSANVDKLKERLTNELGDKLRIIEMDVTSSFLNGKICSPLLATANAAALQTQSIERGTLNAAAQAGLYITVLSYYLRFKNITSVSIMTSSS